MASVRGPGGGYRLGRKASEIDIAGVIAAVDEHIDTTACGGLGDCRGSTPCITHELWQELSRSIHDHLSRISLQDLMDRARRMETAFETTLNWMDEPSSCHAADA